MEAGIAHRIMVARGAFERLAAQHQKLIAAHRRQLIDFLYIELDLGMAFVDLSKTKRSMGNLNGAKISARNARIAYKEILKWLPRARFAGGDKTHFQKRLKELDERI